MFFWGYYSHLSAYIFWSIPFIQSILIGTIEATKPQKSLDHETGKEGQWYYQMNIILLSCLQIALTFVAFCFIRMWFQSRDGLNTDNEDKARIPLSKFPNSQLLTPNSNFPATNPNSNTIPTLHIPNFGMLMRELFWLEKNVLRELLNIKLTAEKIHPNIYTIRRKNPAKSQESPRKNPRKSQEISEGKNAGDAESRGELQSGLAQSAYPNISLCCVFMFRISKHRLM